MEDEGEDLRAHIIGKYGPGAARMVNDPNNHLMQSGRAVGIAFTNDRKIYPTLKAHALMEYLKDKGQNDQANQLMEVMYQEYFEKAQNINSVDVLLQLATRTIHDLNVDEARAAMENPLQLDNIRRKDRIAKTQMGVTGVPYFVIAPKQQQQQSSDSKPQVRPVAFSGAQPVDLMAEILQEVAEDA